MLPSSIEGILIVNKPKGKTSFSLIAALRKILQVKKIGHAGTLDPMAEGVMILLIGKRYTRESSKWIEKDKEYIAEVTLGIATDTFDAEGKIEKTSDYKPSREEIDANISSFQGYVQQIPPMFSAKKIGGKKLYDLARAGKEVERPPQTVHMTTVVESYSYPHLVLSVACSKGTYIRSIAHDLGKNLTSYGHLSSLRRTRCGPFSLESAVLGEDLFKLPLPLAKELVLKNLQRTNASCLLT